MSAETATSTSIFIPLLNEGTPVLRPTLAIEVGENAFKVLPTPNYDPEEEEWEFPPGCVVEGALECRGGQEILVAKKKIDVPLRPAKSS
jgi:hypothetical protein